LVKGQSGTERWRKSTEAKKKKHCKNIFEISVTNYRMLNLKNIRKYLHKHPELSGMEEQTSLFIKKKIEQFNPHKIISKLGGYGLAAIFETKKPGPSVLFRAELDALPIQEIGNHRHKSQTDGVSHACGHDGHITILLGLAERLQKENFKGKTILLFQPAEEIVRGAIRKIIKNC
jgi:amidohydrolase